MTNAKKHTGIKKILVVGFGSIGKRHVEVVRSLFPEVEIGLLRRGNCENNEIDQYEVEFCFTNIDDALEFRPDAAIIANPASLHLGIAMSLAEAHIHLLIEKPIANNADGIQKLIDLCAKNKIVLMTAYNLRFLPSLNRFRKLLHQGKIGVLFKAHVETGQYLPSWRPGVDYRETVSATEELGGGVLLELSHEIDYVQWIFGSVEWVKATTSHQSDLEIDVEDTAHVQLGMYSDLSEKQLIVTLNMDFIRHDSTRQCVAFGEKGSLRWDGVNGLVEYFPSDGKGWSELYSNLTSRNYTYEEEIKHFIAAIESGTPPCVGGQDGLNAVLVIEAAKKSSFRDCSIYLK